MLDERIAELIQADVDGELDAAGRAELEPVLAASEEARRFREEMVRVARLMAELPPVDPPAGLRQRILQHIELPARGGWLDVSVGWFRPASYALAAAAGMVLALGIVHFVPGASPGSGERGAEDMQRLVGSMVGRSGRLNAPDADTLAIAVDGITGQVRLKPLDAAWAMEVELDSAVPVEFRAGLTGSNWRFGGFADPQADVEKVDITGGEVRVVNQGRHRFVLFLRPDANREAAAQAVAIAVTHDGETVFRGELRPGG